LYFLGKRWLKDLGTLLLQKHTHTHISLRHWVMK
jgi:hypothetical protein